MILNKRYWAKRKGEAQIGGHYYHRKGLEAQKEFAWENKYLKQIEGKGNQLELMKKFEESGTEMLTYDFVLSAINDWIV